MASVPAWVWMAVGGCAIVAGASLVIAGRLSVRRGDGRRCPRCRYSMQGLTSLTCPECGHAVKHERELFRVPMRRRWRAAGVCLIVLGVAGSLLPTLSTWAWEKHLPDWALARWAPTDGVLTLSNAMPGVLLGGMTPNEPPLSRRDGLYNEAYARLMEGRFSDSAGSIYLQRLQDAGWSQVRVHPSVPEAWPWDVQLPKPEPARAYSQVRSTVVILGPRHPFNLDYSFVAIAGPCKSVRVKTWASVGERMYVGKAFDAPVDATLARAAFMTPVSGADADAIVRAAVRPVLSTDSKGVTWLKSGWDPLDEDPPEVPFHMGLSIRFLRNGVAVGTARMSIPPTGSTPDDLGSTFISRVVWSEEGRGMRESDLEGLEVEVTGKASLATDSWLIHPTFKRDAWVGKLTLSPLVERREGH